jgi:hypothetical protein
MPITTTRVTVVANAPAVQVYAAVQPGWVSIGSDGSGVSLGGNSGLNLTNGFHMGQATINLRVDAGDQIWAVSSTDTVLSLIAQIEA